MSFAMVSSSPSRPSQQAKPTVATPPEDVSAKFALSRVVTLEVPFNTPKAAAIRAFVSARLLTEDNRRLFIFRRETGNTWTNIALDSTPAEPKITGEPAEIARKLESILAMCPDVNRVLLYDPDGNVVNAAHHGD